MKILLVNWALGFIAGSETWTMTMYDELKRQGHEVDVYGICGNRLIDASYNPKKEYDLAICNHNLSKIQSWNIRKRIYTSHGIMSKLEEPKKGADKYVAVSEEIAEKYKEFKPVIIRNPINCEEFKETKKNSTLKNILYLSNRKAKMAICKEASKDYNFKWFGGGQKGARKAIEWADLVITLGRGCLESLAMGRNVIVFDRFGADGFVTPESILEFRKHNCSGRRYRKNWGVEELREEFKKYDPKLNMRDYILENHDVKKVVWNYLQLTDLPEVATENGSIQ